jgi:hypothetical protein
MISSRVTCCHLLSPPQLFTHSSLVKLSLLSQLLFHHKLYTFYTQTVITHDSLQPPAPPPLPPLWQRNKMKETLQIFLNVANVVHFFAYTSSARFFFRHIFSIYFPDLESSGNILDSGALESFLSRMLLSAVPFSPNNMKCYKCNFLHSVCFEAK